ncbi:MAG TPA: hypothetical protein VIK24_18255 [Pyrinomonadaceae bacterium]
MFSPNLLRIRSDEYLNPANGSWWIVQVLPRNQHSSNLTLRAENDAGFSKLDGTPRDASKAFERLLS